MAGKSLTRSALVCRCSRRRLDNGLGERFSDRSVLKPVEFQSWDTGRASRVERVDPGAGVHEVNETRAVHVDGPPATNCRITMAAIAAISATSSVGRLLMRRFVLIAILIPLAPGAALAENIDPGNDGSKYAWSENLGWINAQPGGPGGSGVQVADSGLTGWAWSENAGWISLAGASYGVMNDACGGLTGYAWSENAGWINFAPTGAGVVIDPKTGIFSGRAWSENAGWITFSSAGPDPYRVATAWRRLPPAGAPQLSATKAAGADVLLSWTAVSGATSFDVVQGGLSVLRTSNGNFQLATQACLVNDTPASSFTASGSPSPGDGYWFLVRAGNCGGHGSYDADGPTQIGLRDPEIAASGNDCP